MDPARDTQEKGAIRPRPPRSGCRGARPARWRPGIGLGSGWLLLVSLAAYPVAADPVPDPAAPGSHEAFLEYLERSRDRVFWTLLEQYDAHLNRNPYDVPTKVERCRFIGQASCTEWGGCAYAEKHDQCVDALWTLHPDAPSAELYRVELLEGEQAITAAQALLDSSARHWTRRNRAALHALLATAYQSQGDPQATSEHAFEAMGLDPSLDLTLVGARALASRGRIDKAVGAILWKLDSSTGYSERIEKIALLTALGDPISAASALERTTVPEDGQPDYLAHARVWLAVGREDHARETLQRASEAEWLQPRAVEIDYERFRLEMEHGDWEAASVAYEALRDGGFWADPFLMERLRLALRHPYAPWHSRDALGALGLLGLIALVGSAPLLLLGPIHYVGLRRALAHPGRVPLETRWRLRHAWLALAALALANLPSCFLGEASMLKVGPDGTGQTVIKPIVLPQISDPTLAFGGVLYVVVLLLALALVWRRRDFRRLSTGVWSVGKTIGGASLALVAMRIFLWIWLMMLPSTVQQELGAGPRGPAVFVIDEILRAIASEYGLAALAGYMVLAVPLAEEVLFRGVLLDGFHRHLGFAWANALQAVLFAAVHEIWVLFPFFLALGLVAGVLARRSQSLLAPCLLHAGNNAVVFAVLVIRMSSTPMAAT